VASELARAEVLEMYEAHRDEMLARAKMHRDGDQADIEAWQAAKIKFDAADNEFKACETNRIKRYSDGYILEGKERRDGSAKSRTLIKSRFGKNLKSTNATGSLLSVMSQIDAMDKEQAHAALEDHGIKVADHPECATLSGAKAKLNMLASGLATVDKGTRPSRFAAEDNTDAVDRMSDEQVDTEIQNLPEAQAGSAIWGTGGKAGKRIQLRMALLAKADAEDKVQAAEAAAAAAKAEKDAVKKKALQAEAIEKQDDANKEHMRVASGLTPDPAHVQILNSIREHGLPVESWEAGQPGGHVMQVAMDALQHPRTRKPAAPEDKPEPGPPKQPAEEPSKPVACDATRSERANAIEALLEKKMAMVNESLMEKDIPQEWTDGPSLEGLDQADWPSLAQDPGPEERPLPQGVRYFRVPSTPAQPRWVNAANELQMGLPSATS